VNFPITRRAISNYPDLIRGIARVKQAAARANKDIGVLSAEKADVIDQVCEELWSGALHDQFVLGSGAGRGGDVDQHVCQ
jgi:aspartate ammonia-lyase